MEERIYDYTVAELIAELEKLPKDLPVFVSGLKNGYENFTLYPSVELIHEPENTYHNGQFQNAGKNDKDTFKAVVLKMEERYD